MSDIRSLFLASVTFFLIPTAAYARDWKVGDAFDPWRPDPFTGTPCFERMESPPLPHAQQTKKADIKVIAKEASSLRSTIERTQIKANSRIGTALFRGNASIESDVAFSESETDASFFIYVYMTSPTDSGTVRLTAHGEKLAARFRNNRRDFLAACGSEVVTGVTRAATIMFVLTVHASSREAAKAIREAFLQSGEAGTSAPASSIAFAR